SCRDAQTGVIAPWAREIVAALDSYTEVSPSGTGLHSFVCGKLPLGGRRHGRIEMYDRDRYFTVTGDHLEGTPAAIEERTTELAALHARVFPAGPSAIHGHPPRGPIELNDARLVEPAP